MKPEALYREIGEIDDDLIQAAHEARGSRSLSMRYRMAGIAACFCLICGGIFFGWQRDTIYINAIPLPAAAKAVVPDGAGNEMVSMTEQELLAYFGMEQLPGTLGEGLVRSEQPYFILWRDQTGRILYDTNTLYYSSEDGSRALSITLTKAGADADRPGEAGKRSKISGVSVLLAASAEDAERTAYWAVFETGGVSVRMVSEGMGEDAFVQIIQEFIGLLQ